MITGTALGRISRAAKIVSLQGKSPFLATTICSRKVWGDKTFETYIDIMMYGKQIDELAPKLTVNTLAAASGEISTSKSDDGKYTNLKLIGQIQVMDPAPACDPKPAPSRAAQKPPPDDSEDVPF